MGIKELVVHRLVALIREQNDTYELGLLDLRNDVVFKAFFGDPRNNKLLLDFLNAILNNTLVSIELMDPNLELAFANDKSAIMDIRVCTHNGEQINIEMQVSGHKSFNERMLLYWSKMYASQAEVGQSYKKLKKAIQIVVADFNLFSKKASHSQFQLVDVENGQLFSKHIEIHVLELQKHKMVNIEVANDLENWLLFLKSGKEIKEVLAMESSVMKDAYEEIQRLSQNPKTRAQAIAREIFLKD